MAKRLITVVPTISGNVPKLINLAPGERVTGRCMFGIESLSRFRLEEYDTELLLLRGGPTVAGGPTAFANVGAFLLEGYIDQTAEPMLPRKEANSVGICAIFPIASSVPFVLVEIETG